MRGGEAAEACDTLGFPIASRANVYNQGGTTWHFKVRRVITGHDANGKAIVKIDEVVSNVQEGRPGAMAHAIWTTEGFPVNNDSQDDAGDPPGRHHAARRHHLPRRRVQPRRAVAQPPHRLDRLHRRHVRRDRHGDGRHHDPSQGRRRAGAARHDPQLDQQRHGALRHRRRPDRRQAGDGRAARCSTRWARSRAAGIPDSPASGIRIDAD